MAFFEYEGTKLFYKEIGEGVPFLLIHGWAIDHRFLENPLEPIFKSCSSDFRRIYIDIPGMGVSLPGKVRNGDDILEVLVHFMDEIAPGEKFYIGGNSFGAHLSRGFCAKYPDKILGMMLLVPAVSKSGSKPKEGTYYKRDEEFLSTLSKEEYENFSVMNANLTRQTYERYVRDVLPSVEINADNDFLHKKLRGTFSFDVDKAFEKRVFKGPVLILTGRYDTAVGYLMQMKWIEVYPASTYIVMDGAGHNASTDQPEMFENVVRGWIEALSND